MPACKDCKKRAFYGTEYQKPLYCKDHKKDGHITTATKCIRPDCQNASIQGDKCSACAVASEVKVSVEVKKIEDAKETIISVPHGLEPVIIDARDNKEPPLKIVHEPPPPPPARSESSIPPLPSPPLVPQVNIADELKQLKDEIVAMRCAMAAHNDAPLRAEIQRLSQALDDEKLGQGLKFSNMLAAANTQWTTMFDSVKQELKTIKSDELHTKLHTGLQDSLAKLASDHARELKDTESQLHLLKKKLVVNVFMTQTHVWAMKASQDHQLISLLELECRKPTTPDKLTAWMTQHGFKVAFQQVCVWKDYYRTNTLNGPTNDIIYDIVFERGL